MSLKYLQISVIISIFKIYSVSCSIFLWSSKKIDISPLQKFTDEDFAYLLEKMDYPRIISYNTPSQNIPIRLKELTSGYFTAYNVNDNLNSINSTDLSGNGNADFLRIQEDTENDKEENLYTLFLIISQPNRRNKREVEEEEESVTTTNPEPNEPVAYIGKHIAEDSYGLIYSSSPFKLRINTTELALGKTRPDMVKVDTQKGSTRFNINIPQDSSERIILRLIFSWLDGYWYLTYVTITYTKSNDSALFNLSSIDQEVTAPAGFSYHCSGSTVFSDPTNDAYLYLSDMQVQIDSKKKSFGDAYDCVHFTTIPIWSGIFVSSLLVIVLMISLIALGDIKTMDKFDNHKTKQLTITVNE